MDWTGPTPEAAPPTPLRPAAERIVDVLSELGATHVLGIPDNGSAPLFDRLARDRRLRLLTVTREGEAFAIAAGLWLGGRSPVVVIQGTGLLESGDSLRGTVLRMGVPLVCLVGYRGFAGMVAAGADPPSGPFAPEQLRRADVDSVALLLEPTLDAWNVPHERLAADRADDQIRRAWSRSRDEERTVALLLTAPLA